VTFARGGVPSVDEIRRDLRRFNFFAQYVGNPGEGDVYVDTHARRFHETLRRLPSFPHPPAVLELGGIPYSMSILLRTCYGAALDTISFYEVETAAASSHELVSADGTERHLFDVRSINVERDLFPFDDGRFDLVMCCEILEHLLINPSHMFYEAHRVLKPGGFIFVSTPNVLRAANIRALQEGRNIYDAYHGNGVYGRHNREFTPVEVGALLQSCGFAVLDNSTVDVYEPTRTARSAGDEDTIMTLAKTAAARRYGLPQGLYVLIDEFRNITRPAISMGVDEIGHLGPGWYDAEVEPEAASRWMGRQATLFLNARGATRVGFVAQAHHPGIETSQVHVEVFVAQRLIGAVQVGDGAWHTYELSVPGAPMDGPIEVRFAVSRTWRPSDVSGGDDTRDLGIRIRTCWCR